MKIDLLVIILLILLLISASVALLLSADSGNIFRPGTFLAVNSKLNVSIETGLLINFSVDTVDWGIGRVYASSQNATLSTAVSNNSNKVNAGNWSGAITNLTNGFILENIGNVNASLFLKSGKTASQFIGGSNPAYMFNVTNNKSLSCINTSGQNLGSWYSISTVGDGTKLCDSFGFLDGNSVRIDIFLRVPIDSYLGDLEDYITATAYAA